MYPTITETVTCTSHCPSYQVREAACTMAATQSLNRTSEWCMLTKAEIRDFEIGREIAISYVKVVHSAMRLFSTVVIVLQNSQLSEILHSGPRRQTFLFLYKHLSP